MNAIIDAKRALAQGWLADAPEIEDWRAARIEVAKKWLAEHGAPHKRDHFWSYTDPKLFEGKLHEKPAKTPPFKTSPFTSKLNDAAVTISPIAKAENALFGRLVAKAHENGARPMAEKCLLAADGVHIRVEGEGGVFVLDRDEWGADYYIGIELAEGASLTLIETGSNPARHNAVIEADIADEAAFDHIRICPENGEIYHGHLFADLGEKSALRSFTLSGAGVFRRMESVVDLHGDHGFVSIAGADILTGKAHQDDTIYITHDAEHCTSRQVFKRVVAKEAVSVFQGKILVKEGAQKTDGYQISQGLMLEDGGEVLSKPELEIYADDVACSHGSTTSGLDETALFYLRSRGVPMDMARKLLVRAFVDEAIEEIDDAALREEIGGIAEEWIFGARL